MTIRASHVPNRASPRNPSRPAGVDVGFLKHVFGVGVIAHDAACNSVKAPVMLLNEHTNSRAVLLLCAFDELTLIRDLLDAIRLGHFDPRAPSCP
jgi:hypothetical protein